MEPYYQIKGINWVFIWKPVTVQCFHSVTTYYFRMCINNRFPVIGLSTQKTYQCPNIQLAYMHDKRYSNGIHATHGTYMFTWPFISCTNIQERFTSWYIWDRRGPSLRSRFGIKYLIASARWRFSKQCGSVERWLMHFSNYTK